MIAKRPIVSVITPTIGRGELLRCIKSVFNQTYRNIQHIIVVDGELHRKKTERTLKLLSKRIRARLEVVYLPYSTGKWGGCIYAAFPALAGGDYIINCDDDNWLEKNHIELLLKTIGSYQWAYSLRNIMYKKCIIKDVCESLGYLHPVWDLPRINHIDTNCYFLPKKVAVLVAPYWYKEEYSRENDRQVYPILRKLFPRYICTRKHTVNYLVHEEMAGFAKFFLEGTKWMVSKYGRTMPWEKTGSK